MRSRGIEMEDCIVLTLGIGFGVWGVWVMFFMRIEHIRFSL